MTWQSEFLFPFSIVTIIRGAENSSRRYRQAAPWYLASQCPGRRLPPDLPQWPAPQITADQTAWQVWAGSSSALNPGSCRRSQRFGIWWSIGNKISICIWYLKLTFGDLYLAQSVRQNSALGMGPEALSHQFMFNMSGLPLLTVSLVLKDTTFWWLLNSRAQNKCFNKNAWDICSPVWPGISCIAALLAMDAAEGIESLSKHYCCHKLS